MQEPARFPGTARGRIGFMSRQRRENRSTPATKICRRWPRFRQWVASCMDRTKASGRESLDSFTPGVHARTHGQTASPAFHPSDEGLSLGAPALPAGWATDSLQSDYRNTQLAWLVGENLRRGWPLLGPSRWTQAVRSASFMVIPSAHPLPSRLARFHRIQPQLPAAKDRRTERYDGKRDHYFQHAA